MGWFIQDDLNSCDYAEPQKGWFWIDNDDNKDPTNTVITANPRLKLQKQQQYQM